MCQDIRFLTYLPAKNYAEHFLASFKLAQSLNINLFPEKYSDYNGTELKIFNFEQPPSVYYVYDSNQNIVDRIGEDMKILEILAKVLNFKIKIVEDVHGHRWGQTFSNGTWNGMIGSLVYDKADISTGNNFVEYSNYKYIDYTTPFSVENACFVTPSPRPLSRWRSITLPFSGLAWASVAVSFLVAALLLHLISFASLQDESTKYESWSFNLLYVLGILTMRSPNTKPNHLPLRMYLAIIWVFAILISTSYSANLVSFLFVIQKSPPIKTLKQLADSSLRFGGTAIWVDKFKNSVDETVRSFASRFEVFPDLNWLFDQVDSGKFTAIQNKHQIEFLVSGKYKRGASSSLRLVEECFLSYNIAITTQKYAPMLENFNKLLSRIIDSGLIKRWQNEVLESYRVQNKREKVPDKTEELSGPQPLSIEHIQGLFMIYLLGIILSLLVLAAELIRTKLSKK